MNRPLHLDQTPRRRLAEAINEAASGRTALIISPSRAADREGRPTPAAEPGDWVNGERMIAARLERDPAGLSRPRPGIAGSCSRFRCARYGHGAGSGGSADRLGYLISRAAERVEIPFAHRGDRRGPLLRVSWPRFCYGERLTSHDLAFRTLTDLRGRFFERLIPLVPAESTARGGPI